jgi:S-adenosylmethionine-diacylgycerolhomoserine-N-methlytransferase
MSMNAPTELSVGHGAAMDRMYRFQRHIYDASRRYYLLGRDELLDRLKPPPGGAILEIGCGTGRNLAGAARRYPDARLFGIDISQEMLKTALKTAQQNKFLHRARFACADATFFDPLPSLGQSKFDRVYCSFTLSMVPDWQSALRHAASLLAPSGELHIIDFGQSTLLPRNFRRALFHWLEIFHVQPRPNLKSALQKIAVESGSAIEFEQLYRDYTWLAVIKAKPGFQQLAL